MWQADEGNDAQLPRLTAAATCDRTESRLIRRNGPDGRIAAIRLQASLEGRHCQGDYAAHLPQRVQWQGQETRADVRPRRGTVDPEPISVDEQWVRRPGGKGRHRRHGGDNQQYCGQADDDRRTSVCCKSNPETRAPAPRSSCSGVMPLVWASVRDFPLTGADLATFGVTGRSRRPLPRLLRAALVPPVRADGRTRSAR